MGPMQKNINQKLADEFTPIFLEVENDGDKHSAGAAAEMHFKVTLVSGAFEGKMKVARHRLVYACLAEELAGQVHALALNLYTEAEWSELSSVPDTPECASKR